MKQDDTATGYVGSFVGFLGKCVDVYGNDVMVDDQRTCFVREDSQLMYKYIVYVNAADYADDQLMTKARAICKKYSPVGVTFTIVAS